MIMDFVENASIDDAEGRMAGYRRLALATILFAGQDIHSSGCSPEAVLAQASAASFFTGGYTSTYELMARFLMGEDITSGPLPTPMEMHEAITGDLGFVDFLRAKPSPSGK